MNVESEQNACRDFDHEQSGDDKRTSNGNQGVATHQAGDKWWDQNVSVEGKDNAHGRFSASIIPEGWCSLF